MRMGAVLMASGAATRFGSNKLLYPIDGVTMIERTFSAVPAFFFEQANVVSCYPEILSLAAEFGYRPISNPQAAEGQSASVRLGLSPLADMDGVLFTVCDQPWLARKSVLRLLEAFSEHPSRICSLGWRGRRGSPTIFPAELFPALLSLSGDQKGGVVVQAHQERLYLVEAASPLELRDVDIPEDSNRLDQLSPLKTKRV